ncbi:MAG: amidohydrolase family protein [Planctomycetes bacterium]|nr:amidohydrolase family protein [Planctomycetota bacterium]
MYRNGAINQMHHPSGADDFSHGGGGIGEGVRVYRAGAVRDAAGLDAQPGAVAIRSGRIVRAGTPDQVLANVDADTPIIDLPDRLLLPGLVNAHVHLDLTHMGPRPYGGDFIEWVRMVMRDRATDAGAIGVSVRRGIDLSTAAGVLTVGDIAGSPAAHERLSRAPLRGVSYVEHLGRQPVDRAARSPRGSIRQGIEAHAPYSTGPAIYEEAAASGLPICTHLAETPAELEFVAHATGPFRMLLESMGKWNDAMLEDYGRGLHPVAWLASVAKPQAAWLLAHCNYIDDVHIEMLAQRPWSVAYCPRASDYFGHRDHRYRDMLAAGVNVCLGTDSIVCHGSLSILDEMRHLHQRDATDPLTLLKMATVNGMRGLALNEKDAAFTPGAAPGLIALRYDANDQKDPLRQILSALDRPSVRVLEGVMSS